MLIGSLCELNADCRQKLDVLVVKLLLLLTCLCRGEFAPLGKQKGGTASF